MMGTKYPEAISPQTNTNHWEDTRKESKRQNHKKWSWKSRGCKGYSPAPPWGPNVKSGVCSAQHIIASDGRKDLGLQMVFRVTFLLAFPSEMIKHHTGQPVSTWLSCFHPLAIAMQRCELGSARLLTSYRSARGSSRQPQASFRLLMGLMEYFYSGTSKSLVLIHVPNGLPDSNSHISTALSVNSAESLCRGNGWWLLPLKSTRTLPSSRPELIRGTGFICFCSFRYC